MRRRTSKFLLSLWLATYGLSASAGIDANPPIIYKHLLPSAIQVQITPRGMKYFDTRLSEILGNLGIKLDEGYFPAFSVAALQPIDPEDYRDSHPEEVKMYLQVRELLTKWFVGFSLNNHQPVVEIGESGYVANFKRFGLVTDEFLMRALGKTDGAVLAVELEIEQMTVATNSVVVWDVQNQFTNKNDPKHPEKLKVGLEDLSISTGDTGQNVPLKIRLPFYVRMNGDMLEFEALKLENNIDSVPLSLKYKKLIVPTFSVEINGNRFFLNNAELDRYLTNKVPVILEKVREHLADFATKQLPGILNKKAKQVLSGSLEQVQNIIPPGKEAYDTRPDFKWGLKLQQINLNNSLKIDLTTYVEDPINSKSVPKTAHASRGATSFNLIPSNLYDIGLSVDRALINRIMQLGFERKNFEKIQQKDGSYLKLTSAPTIDFVKTPTGEIEVPGETFIKLHVAVENKPDSIFLKDTIIVDFDIIAKLRQRSDKSGMQILLHSIDTNSMQMDDSYFSFAGRLVKDKVRQGVRDKLRENSAKWKTTEESLPGGFPLPPKILGLQLDINRVVMDPNGHLVMYLNYANTGVN